MLAGLVYDPSLCLDYTVHFKYWFRWTMQSKEWKMLFPYGLLPVLYQVLSGYLTSVVQSYSLSSLSAMVYRPQRGQGYQLLYSIRYDRKIECALV